MTIPGFGRLLPIQCDILCLCGVNLDAWIDDAPTLTDERRIQIIKLGLKSLRHATGRDFGYDIAAWESYLDAAHKDQYRHPYGYSVTKKHVQAAKSDPEVARLFSMIQSEQNST